MKDHINKKVWVTTTKSADTIVVKPILNFTLWVLAILISAIVVFSSMYFDVFTQSPSLMAAFIIVGVVLILAIVRYTSWGVKAFQFVLAARMEMRKVVWPTRQETMNSTLVVMAVVAIASLFIYFVGLLFMHLIQAILS